jgi:hypothetical protein
MKPAKTDPAGISDSGSALGARECLDPRNPGVVSRTASIFEPPGARDITRHRILDDILSLFGGRAQPMVAQLAEAGKLTLADVRGLEETIRNRERQQKAEKARKKQ